MMEEERRQGAEKLLDSMGDIDEAYVSEADPYKKEYMESAAGKGAAHTANARSSKRGIGAMLRRNRRALGAIAACACIVFGAAAVMNSGVLNMKGAQGGMQEAEVPALAEASEDMPDGTQDSFLVQGESPVSREEQLLESKQALADENEKAVNDNKEMGAEPSKAGGSMSSSVSAENSPSQSFEADQAAYDIGFSEFDGALISYLSSRGYAAENYMVSPTSYRAALALAIEGAAGETKEQLLEAAGFGGEEELQSWYGSVLDDIKIFSDDLEARKSRFEKEKEWLGPDAAAPDGAFEIANSVWHNSSKQGTLRQSYIDAVKDKYDAKAASVPAGQITDAVNGWVDEKTHGMIPRIAEDMSECASVLVNALYLRTSWYEGFEPGMTREGDFRCIDGSTVKKDFMQIQSDFRYYEDDDTQLVVLPMDGGIDAVFVLGDGSDLSGKLAKAGYEEVRVKLPRFELETSFDEGELVDFLQKRGAVLPFMEDAADLSAMCDDARWYIDDIIQKSKIKVDEDGIEAAAVTAIMVMDSEVAVPKEPKHFTADRPFSFALITSGNSPELLFYGQVVK